MSEIEKSEDLPKEEEPFGLGCALEQFTEVQEITDSINNIKNSQNVDKSVEEKSYERFLFILGQYKEQPHLLDPHLNRLLDKLIDIVRNGDTIEMKHKSFKYMFIIINVRGYKVIVRQLPHEVTDFEPVLKLLESQNPSDPETWTTRYVLLLWLSIIVMIPFHMSRFDGFTPEDDTNKKTVMSRILDVIKTYVVVSDKCRDAAAYLSSMFITRYDVKEKYLSSYFDWAIEQSSSINSNVFVKYGTLASVAMILKHGKREDLLPHAQKLLQWIVNDEVKNSSGSNVQKLAYKIIQRIGLTFLPPRIATWRYQRGNRSLAANLSAGDNKCCINTVTVEDQATSDDIEVPDEVEEVIDQLIQGLRGADGIVRWSAAKGIGRVTARLPKELGDEVVGSVLELFNPREGDGAWHGGCLALAELGRRGLLLPNRLPEVVPVVLQALVYDEPKGYSSVGSHIRDAASYVCWAFARAYETNILKPFVNQIASTLLIVTCFDREINCRRAASAAFQENVGRQGTFPHGIDILTAADFFAVSVRNNAYLNISVYISQFEEYTLPLINHLIDRKIDHWDCVIRELTAKALHNLTPQAPEYMVNSILPKLFEKAQSIDLNSRHGSVLAIGHILYALSKIDNKRNIEEILNKNLIQKIEGLIPQFRTKMYFRGLGGELMRQACCDFIEKCSLANLKFTDENVQEEWLNLLNECFSYTAANIRNAAVNALPILLNQYYCDSKLISKQNEIVEKYLYELQSVISQENRMGHALALGVLPKFILKSNLDRIIDSLIESTFIAPTTVKWAESRKDSIKALTSISSTMKNEIEFSENNILKIYHVLLEGLEDYTQDKRGDVGAWVREASIIGLQTITFNLVQQKPEMLNKDLIIKILTGIGQQSVEKIDRTRALAGKIFYSFIYNDPSIPNIPNHEEIQEIFLKDVCDNLNWNSAADTFPKFVELLQFPSFTNKLMLGIICSVGGLTESLVKNSSSSFFSFLKVQKEQNKYDEIKRICDTIYQIFSDHQKIDRIIIPVFRFLDKLLGSGCIESVLKDSTSQFAKLTLKLILSEISGCKDIYKIIDGINVLCQYIQINGDVSRSALVQLSILLCHRQSYVRKLTSTTLYESILVFGDDLNISQENLDIVMQLLSETNWEDSVENIRGTRNELCKLLGIKVPVLKTKV